MHHEKMNPMLKKGVYHIAGINQATDDILFLPIIYLHNIFHVLFEVVLILGRLKEIDESEFI